jgi:hypothetical protein
VIVVGGEEDLTIKVSDEGGGIKRSEISQIFSYFYSTAKLSAEMDDSKHYSNTQVKEKDVKILEPSFLICFF